MHPATDEIQSNMTIVNNAYLVRHNPELHKQVQIALASILSVGENGISVLVDRLYEGVTISDGSIQLKDWGDMTWNELLIKREIIFALRDGNAKSAKGGLEKLLNATCKVEQWSEIIVPALQSALETLGAIDKAVVPQEVAITPGITSFNSKVVVIDNTSPNDNWITNNSSVHVSVACEEMFGHFVVDLLPGEAKRITFNASANVYPVGKYSYDDLKYKLGKGEKWEVRREQSRLIMVKVAETENSPTINGLQPCEICMGNPGLPPTFYPVKIETSTENKKDQYGLHWERTTKRYEFGDPQSIHICQSCMTKKQAEAKRTAIVAGIIGLLVGAFGIVLGVIFDANANMWAALACGFGVLFILMLPILMANTFADSTNPIRIAIDLMKKKAPQFSNYEFYLKKDYLELRQKIESSRNNSSLYEDNLFGRR